MFPHRNRRTCPYHASWSVGTGQAFVRRSKISASDTPWRTEILSRSDISNGSINATPYWQNPQHHGHAAAVAKFSKAIQQPGHDEDNDVEIVQADGPPREAARENKRMGRHGGRPQRPQLGLSSRGPRGDGPRGGPPRRDGARPFGDRGGPPPSKHGVKHKAKGNRPR